MLYNVFIWFLDQENVGLYPQIIIRHEVIYEISEMSDSKAAIFKMAEMSCVSHFFFW